MIGLVSAELLKIRKRQATYVLLVIELVLTAIVFLAGGQFWTISGLVSFPQAYATFFFQTIFQLGSLIAIVFFRGRRFSPPAARQLGNIGAPARRNTPEQRN